MLAKESHLKCPREKSPSLMIVVFFLSENKSAYTKSDFDEAICETEM